MNSELIQGINDQFRDRSESLELVSFSESKEMRGLGVLADNLSLTGYRSLFLKIPRHWVFRVRDTSPLNGNHLEIVKFSSKEDNNYERVAGNISRLNKIVDSTSEESGSRDNVVIVERDNDINIRYIMIKIGSCRMNEILDLLDAKRF